MFYKGVGLLSTMCPPLFFILITICLSEGQRHSANSFYYYRHDNNYPTTNQANYPFRNTSLDWSARVDDLVSRFTLHELVLQLSRGGGPTGPAPAIPRLGIQPYQWFSNCGRGDAQAPGNATAFPQSIGLSASFSPSLRYRIAEATSYEQRAKHNYFLKQGIFDIHTSLSCFSPNIDIARDPRWGRNQETPGEDPYMNGVFADAFVRGIQGEDGRYIRVSAGCKHFAVCAGPENIPADRRSFSANVSMRDLRMTFLPAFRMCVEAGTYSIYTTYNAVNGVPATASEFLMTQVLRNEWNFTGYVLSDFGAIENVMTGFHYRNTSMDVALTCVKAGCDMEVPGPTHSPFYDTLENAVNQGLITEDFLREKAKPLFYTRMRLGEFDPPAMNPYTSLDQNVVVESPEYQELAVEAALKSFVLLKNENNTLPLDATVVQSQSIGVVGPMADNVQELFGDYAANTDKSYVTSPLDGLKQVSQSIKYASGCDDTVCKNYSSNSIKAAVTGTDINFVLLGTGQSVEAEGHDRPDTELSGYQKMVLEDTLFYAPNTTVVLLLFSASPVNITQFVTEPTVAAIVQCFFPAQASGTSLKHFLLNDHKFSIPAGRLPFTWPRLASQIPPMVDYSMVRRTYRYFQGDPLYPFGYGLSYVQFSYLGLRYPRTIQAGEPLSGSVVVHNEGASDADEAVQVYISWQNASLPAPVRQLVWFDRVRVAANSQFKVDFTIDPQMMALWLTDSWVISKGIMLLHVGGQQPYQNIQVPSNVITGPFYIQNEKDMGVY